jgi:hypothetical protein
MGAKGSVAEPPRLCWTYLVANMHEFRLVIDPAAQTISVIELVGGAAPAARAVLGLAEFLAPEATERKAAFETCLVSSHLDSFSSEAQLSVQQLQRKM